MMKRLVECCFFLAILSSTRANITALCDSADMYWEIREDKQGSSFTCTGLAAQDAVQWALQDSTFQYLYLGFCPPRSSESQLGCKSQYDFGQPSRVSDNSSVMVVYTAGVSVSLLNGKGRLICSVLGLPSDAASCRMDYIYPGENISCSVQLSNSTRTVFGQCAISKIRSAQNRYRCEWIRTKESPKEEVLIANASMTVVSSVGTYFKGWCNFTSSPPPDGQYTYRVTVVPGEVTVNASFIGSSEMFETTMATPATTRTTEKAAPTTAEESVSTTGTKAGTITTEETTATKEGTTGITKDATTTNEKAATSTTDAATARTTKKATTPTSDYSTATRETTVTTVSETDLGGQRCQDRCSCKRVTVQVKLASGPVIYP